jgi:hypothetical protein
VYCGRVLEPRTPFPNIREDQELPRDLGVQYTTKITKSTANKWPTASPEPYQYSRVVSNSTSQFNHQAIPRTDRSSNGRTHRPYPFRALMLHVQDGVPAAGDGHGGTIVGNIEAQRPVGLSPTLSNLTCLRPKCLLDGLSTQRYLAVSAFLGEHSSTTS